MPYRTAGDGQNSVNMTNLAIKGIVGIAAMAEIAKIVGDSHKSSNYSSIAADYVNKWQPRRRNR